MAVGAVGNGPPFSKARWARLRVHGAGSVHGLFGLGGGGWRERQEEGQSSGKRWLHNHIWVTTLGGTRSLLRLRLRDAHRRSSQQS